jgi:hypothetical protein
VKSFLPTSAEKGTAMNDQKPAGWVLVCVAMLLVPAFYVFSSGPACWLSSRWGAMGLVSHVYRPITRVVEVSGSDTLMSILQTYSALGSTEDAAWAFTPEDPGNAEWTSGWSTISMGGTIVLPLTAVAPSPVSEAVPASVPLPPGAAEAQGPSDSVPE